MIENFMEAHFVRYWWAAASLQRGFTGHKTELRVGATGRGGRVTHGWLSLHRLSAAAAVHAQRYQPSARRKPVAACITSQVQV